MGGVLYRMAVAVRGGIPLLLGILLGTIVYVPFGTPELSVLLPSLTMPLVYHWAIYRPQTMPPAIAFLIGLWQDIIVGGPLGLMALVLVLLCGVVETQRQVFRTQAFAVNWMGYAIISLALTLLAWGIASWWYWTGFGLVPFVTQWGLGVVVYPLLAIVFTRLDRALFDRR